MKNNFMRMTAIAITAIELLSTVSAAVAQDASSARTVQRQQREIIRQQQQILRNQKVIEQQRRQLARSQEATAPAADPAPDPAGSGFGGLFQCPPHYYFSWFSKYQPCLPDLNYFHGNR